MNLCKIIDLIAYKLSKATQAPPQKPDETSKAAETQEAQTTAELLPFESPVDLNQPPRELPRADERAPARLALIVGHTSAAPGALSALGWTEYAYNLELAKLAESIAAAQYSSRVFVCVVLRDGIGIAGAYKRAEALDCDAAIELHFNAFNNKASGTETLCSLDEQDVAFAQIVHAKICKVFQRAGTSRGVKPIPRSGRGGQNVYAFGNGPNCLIEPFFGDNVIEAMAATKRKRELAQALVESFVEWVDRKSKK